MTDHRADRALAAEHRHRLGFILPLRPVIEPDHGGAVSELPIQHCFPPVAAPDTRVLILGSLPGAVSLAAGRYYAHPRNLFWRLAGDLIGADLVPLAYDDRLAALLAAGIGLWDIVAAATRRGSLDAAIALRKASDLAALTAELPALRAIAFNGATAARIGRRQLGPTSPWILVDLPSSSPAYTVSFEEKAARWRALRPYLKTRPRRPESP